MALTEVCYEMHPYQWTHNIGGSQLHYIFCYYVCMELGMHGCIHVCVFTLVSLYVKLNTHVPKGVKT
jgi:hypothetical protein